MDLFLGQVTVLAIHLQFLCSNGGKESGGKSQKWINEIVFGIGCVCNGLENYKTNTKTI